MNKYQEALDGLKEQIENATGMRIESNDTFYDWISTLQELVDKVTPKKPLVKHYEEIGEKPYIKICCPNGCRVQLSKVTEKNHAHEHHFCNKCGRAIDWGKEDE